MHVIFFLIAFLLLVLLSMPVAFALGVSTTFVIILGGDVPLGIIPHRLWTGLDKYAFVAIPLFILAGELMSSSGILIRLLDFARLLVGRIRGGLLQMNILVSMLFGGINGSAVADCSAVGSMLIPATIDEYKDPDFAAAVTACSAVVGPIIPPSLPMLIYVLAAGNVSIGGLFLGGVVPGIMLGVGMMIITYIVSKRHNYVTDKKSYSFQEVILILRRFILPALLPFIMVGGIVSGVFTPTEAGGIAVFYAILVGFCITKELTMKAFYQAFLRTTVVTAVVLMMISVSNISTWWLSTEHVPMIMSNFINSITSNSNVFILLMVTMFLVIGLFLEAAAAIIMLVPVFLPIAMSYHLDPIQFGLITCMGLLIGLVTPPVALCLFITSGIAKRPVEMVFKASVPLLIVNIAVLILIAYFPSTYLWVPKLFGY